jgi:hypothetical protein
MHGFALAGKRVKARPALWQKPKRRGKQNFLNLKDFWFFFVKKNCFF